MKNEVLKMIASRAPMGWNSWNTFTKDIDEQLIKETADAMVDGGYLAAGYEYLVIDDCWSKKERDENGMLVADEEKFPNGMKAVADYVHSKGLKFGMYSCCGVKTCAGYPGSFGHEFDDANYFASVGIDLLKYDNCYHPGSPSYQSYNRMALALRATGKEILFSACNWGNHNVHEWPRSVGAHMYRSTGDITDTFESIKGIVTKEKDKFCYSAPGCFNDLDMLVTGLYGKGNIGFGQGCTAANYRYHFAIWCMLSSPLMLGCDIRNVDEETKKLITNPTLISICRDEDARPPIIVGDNRGQKENFSLFKHLSDGTYAIGFFNAYDVDKDIMMPYSDLGLDPLCGYGFDVTDAFTGEHLGIFRDCIDMHVEAGGCRVLTAKLVKVK